MSAIEAHQEQMIANAWWAEHMARQKRLKGLDHYTKAKSKKPVAQARRDYYSLKARLGR